MLPLYQSFHQNDKQLKPVTETPLEGTEAPPLWDDKELFIRKVFEQDPKKGFEILFRKYYQPLCNYIIRYVYSKEIAQDLVSELFYSLWKNEAHKRMTFSYRAYLYLAARNSAFKYLRKEVGKGEIESLPENEPDYISAWPSPQQILQHEELRLKMEKAIEALPPQNHKVFLMNWLEGKKYATISQELNIAPKTVEAHMSKALALLRKALKNDLWIVILCSYYLL